ncbi:MAG: hypothetical protein WCF84_06320 [Anaerolineae bacterium]
MPMSVSIGTHSLALVSNSTSLPAEEGAIMSDTGWIALGSIATAIGIFVAVIAILYARGQLEESKNVAQADFLLRLDDVFQQHSKTHMLLRPGGDWAGGPSGPKNTSEWGLVESYMGLFEFIQILIENHMVQFDIIDRRYGYRVANIDNNPIIHEEKLVKRAKDWQDFIKLRDRVAARHPGWFTNLSPH